MVKITGNGLKSVNKHLEKKIADFAKKVKNDTINGLKQKGLYKPGITEVVVKYKGSVDKWKKAFTKK